MPLLGNCNETLKYYKILLTKALMPILFFLFFLSLQFLFFCSFHLLFPTFSFSNCTSLFSPFPTALFNLPSCLSSPTSFPTSLPTTFSHLVSRLTLTHCLFGDSNSNSNHFSTKPPHYQLS